MLLGVDVGGTFTDAVVAAGGPAGHGEGADDAGRPVARACSPPSSAALEQAGADAEEVEAFAHGTTVATNALLEGNGARTVLVATERLRGRRRARPPGARRPLPPVRRAPGAARAARAARRRAGADDARRAAATPLDGPGRARARRSRRSIPRRSPSACCTPTATRSTSRRSARRCAERLPGVHVSLSPRGRRHVPRVRARGDDRARRRPLPPARRLPRARWPGARAGAGLPAPDVMQSSGGLATLDQARAHAALTVLSGPAGGAAGAAWAALAAGEPDALCFDMGGTSCDVCVIEDGSARETGRPARRRPPDRAADARPPHRRRRRRLDRLARRGRRAARRPAARPARARARPPTATAATEPTVTDANVVLGLLGTGAALAGSIELDAGAARDAVGGARRARSGSGCVECAEGIRRVANAEMVRALRVMTVERGVDPRGLALLAFGGAGPLHAAAIAEELGMTRILCPRASGVLAALGLVVSDRRRDAQRSVLLSRRRADRRRRCATEIAALASAPATARAGPRRAALPRPGVRARASTRRGARPRRPARGVRRRPRAGLRLPRRRRRGRARHAARHRHGARAGDRRRRGGRRRRAARATSAARAWLGGEEHEAAVLTGEPAPGTRADRARDLRAARGDARRPARLGRPRRALRARSGWSRA